MNNMGEDIYKYEKKYFKNIGAKKSDGNYGSQEAGGSLSITVRYDHNSELEKIKEELEGALEFDAFALGFITDVIRHCADLDVVVSAKPDTATRAPPVRPTGNSNWFPNKPVATPDGRSESGKTYFQPMCDHLMTWLIENQGWRKGKFDGTVFKAVGDDTYWNIYIKPDEKTGMAYTFGSVYTKSTNEKLYSKDPGFPDELRDLVEDAQRVLMDYKRDYIDGDN